jgi:hypothetical protein
MRMIPPTQCLAVAMADARRSSQIPTCRFLSAARLGVRSGRTISSDNPVTEAPNELLGRVTAVYRLVVHPVVLGAGTPFFPPGVSRFDLRLIESRAFASGAMYLGYEAVR